VDEQPQFLLFFELEILRNDYQERRHILRTHTFRENLLEDLREDRQEVRLEQEEGLVVEALEDAKRDF
jgi:hypothetical protein